LVPWWKLLRSIQIRPGVSCVSTLDDGWKRLDAFAWGRAGHYFEPMSLLPEEKELVTRALQLYAQMIGSQYGPQEMQALVPVIKGILKKLDQVGPGAAEPGVAPIGISEEWFQKICSSCPKAGGPSGCQDPVTAKYPGKCDPILTWERNKRLSES
jgi:hypothetical protein